MADQIQFRGGTAAESASFTGAAREVTVDTTNNTLRVHDGTTAGGHLLAKAADLTTTQTAQTNALAALGVASGATSLGTFSGSAFSDNQTVKAVLQAIETLLETKQTLLGTTASNLGTFSGSTITDSSSIKNALQELETRLEAVDLDTDDIAALTGISENITNLGTFSGTTISDNLSVKAALQALETATELRATVASPAFTGNLATLIGSGDHPVVQRIQGGFPDINLRTNGSNVALNQNEGRLLWEDAGGGAVAAIKQTMLPTAPMRFFVGGITASDERLRINANGRVGIGETNPAAQLHVSGSVLVKADFPDFQMRSGGERRVIFEDAGGGAQGAIKFASNKMSFFAGGGIASGNQIFSIDADSMDVDQTLVLSDGLTLDSVALTTVQTSGESFADNDTSFMTSAAIADYVAANSGMAGVTASAAELNILDGATLTVDEINLLDGVTATTAELNYVDGVTSSIQTQINTQAALTTAHGTILGATAGTAGASQAVILDSNKDVTGLRNLTLTGNLTVQGTTTTVDTVTMEAANAVVFEGATADDNETTLTIVDPDADRTIKLPNQSGCLPVLAADSTTAITSTPEELNILDGVTSTAAELNLLDGVTATTAELNYVDGVTSAIQTQLDGKYATSGGTLTGSVTIDAGFPDLTLKSNGERRLLFSDAGGSANAGLKYASSALQFVYGGVASGDIEMKIEDAKVTITNELALPATVSAAAATDITIVDNTADAFEIKEGSNQYVAITSTDSGEKVEIFKNLHLAGERLFFDSGSQLIRLHDNQTSALKIENHDGSSQDFLDFKTSNSGCELIFGAPNQFNNTITVGADDTGHDVIFYGATASAYMQWDESADALVLAGSATLDVAGDIDVDGTSNLDVLDVDGTANFASTVEVNNTLTMKANINFTGSGREIRFKDNTYNALRFQKEDGTTYMGFDTQGDATIFFSQPLDVNTTMQIDGTVTVGVDDTGYDVKFFGASASAYMLWDESADDLILAGAAGLVVPDGQLTLGSTAVTSTAAELNILDGVTATAAELNLLDGVTATTAELNYVDGVTSNIQTQLDALQASDAELTELATMASTAAAAIADLTATEIQILDGATVTTAELNILDGVTSTAAELNILDGVTSTAAELNILDGVTSTTAELNILDGVTASAADINLIDGITNGTVIASKAIITDSNKDITGGRNITITGELDAATLDISGDADIDGTLNADAVDIDGNTNMAGNLTFSGGATNMVLTDNTAGALDIKEGTTSYMKFDTTDGSELITVAKDTNFTGAVKLGGTAITSTAAELNILDGVTSTAAELNILDGVTSTAAELNILDGVTATTAEINVLDGPTAGTVSASKAVVVDSNKDITGFRNVTATGTLTVDSVGVSAIQTSGESFSDNDTSLMTSAAIDDRIAAAAATETSGTWTATFRGSTGEPSTLKTKTGYYVKIGKMVTVTLSTGATDWSDYTGEFSITGLPATANANTHFVGTFVSSGSVDESNNNDGLVAYVAGNGTTITVKAQDYNNAAVNWSATSNDYINLTITYFTA